MEFPGAYRVFPLQFNALSSCPKAPLDAPEELHDVTPCRRDLGLSHAADGRATPGGPYPVFSSSPSMDGGMTGFPSAPLHLEPTHPSFGGILWPVAALGLASPQTECSYSRWLSFIPLLRPLTDSDLHELVQQ